MIVRGAPFERRDLGLWSAVAGGAKAKTGMAFVASDISKSRCGAPAFVSFVDVDRPSSSRRRVFVEVVD